MKWCPTQQAFPRSAILTDIVSIALATSSWLVSIGEADLFREIPDMVWERFSLEIMSAQLDCAEESTPTQSSLGVSGRRRWCWKD